MRKSFIAAALAVLALAGCGGSGPSREEYEANVRETRDRVDFAVKRVAQAQSEEELVSRLDEASTSIDDAAAELESGGAAEGFEDETEVLVSSLEEMAVDLSGTADQLRDPTFAENVLPQTRGLQFESWTRANRTLRDLKKQGIDVEPWA